MTYITGDTHREFYNIEDFCRDNETSIDDVIIILGDAGINFHGNPDDTELKRELTQLPITLFCIHGNHEMRPERKFMVYKEEERFGGVVYVEEEFQNLLFAKDGEIYDFDGNKCIAIGGAYSVDKPWRKPDVDWWDDEQPDEQTMTYVEKRLKEEGWEVDYVLSHTCPYKYKPKEAFLAGISQGQVDSTTEQWLDTIDDRLDCYRWFCGHFHTEKDINRMRFLYKSILELDE